MKAFDSTLGFNVKNDDGSYYHSEINVFGQTLAVAESKEGTTTGNSMQFALQFEKGQEEVIEKAYNTLKDEDKIIFPLESCNFSPYMTDFIDKFNVRWCLFIF